MLQRSVERQSLRQVRPARPPIALAAVRLRRHAPVVVLFQRRYRVLNPRLAPLAMFLTRRGWQDWFFEPDV